LIATESIEDAQGTTLLADLNNSLGTVHDIDESAEVSTDQYFASTRDFSTPRPPDPQTNPLTSTATAADQPSHFVLGEEALIISKSSATESADYPAPAIVVDFAHDETGTLGCVSKRTVNSHTTHIGVF
jgi:hypothetical protein